MRMIGILRPRSVGNGGEIPGNAFSQLSRYDIDGSLLGSRKGRLGLGLCAVVIAMFFAQRAPSENAVPDLTSISSTSITREQEECELIAETLDLIENRERRLVSGCAVFSVQVFDNAWGVLPACQIEEIGAGLIVEYQWKGADDWTVVLRNLAQDEVRRMTSVERGLMQRVGDDSEHVVHSGSEDDGDTSACNREDDPHNWPEQLVRAHLFPATRDPGASIAQWSGTFELLKTGEDPAIDVRHGQKVLSLCYYLTVPSELPSLLTYESKFHMLLDTKVPWGAVRRDTERRATLRDEFALEVDIDIDHQYPIRMGSKGGASSALGGCEEKWVEPYAIAPGLFVPRKYVLLRGDAPRPEILKCELLVDQSSLALPSPLSQQGQKRAR